MAERNAFEAALGRKDMLTLFKLVGAGALQLEATTGVSSAPNGTGVPWVEPQCRQKQGKPVTRPGGPAAGQAR